MTIKYSILLPTKNGAKYLRHCINAVLEQTYKNIELIISDNANSDGSRNIINEYKGDERVVSLRLEKQVSVTENWKNALKAASGDYVLMLGDDDLLLHESIEKLNKAIINNNYPDCVTYNAIGYVTPDSIKNNVDSYYSKEFFSYPDEYNMPRMLSHEERINLVKDMYDFKVSIPLNMQTTLVSTKAIEKIKEGIFQAPFPDHYALNALLLNTDSWFFLPEKILIIGVSPKSFGHYVYSNEQKKGKEYLGIDSTAGFMLPGNELLNNMCVWLDKIKKQYPRCLNDIQINKTGYIARQIFWWLKEYKTGSIDKKTLINRLKLIRFREYSGLLKYIFDGHAIRKLNAAIKNKKKEAVKMNMENMTKIEGIKNINEFACWLQKQYAE